MCSIILLMSAKLLTNQYENFAHYYLVILLQLLYASFVYASEKYISPPFLIPPSSICSTAYTTLKAYSKTLQKFEEDMGATSPEIRTFNDTIYTYYSLKMSYLDEHQFEKFINALSSTNFYHHVKANSLGEILIFSKYADYLNIQFALDILSYLIAQKLVNSCYQGMNQECIKCYQLPEYVMKNHPNHLDNTDNLADHTHALSRILESSQAYIDFLNQYMHYTDCIVKSVLDYEIDKQLIDLTNPTIIRDIKPNNEYCTTSSSKDGRIIAQGCSNGRLRIYTRDEEDSYQMTQSFKFAIHDHSITNVTLSADGSTLVIVLINGTVFIGTKIKEKFQFNQSCEQTLLYKTLMNNNGSIIVFKLYTGQLNIYTCARSRIYEKITLLHAPDSFINYKITLDSDNKTLITRDNKTDMFIIYTLTQPNTYLGQKIEHNNINYAYYLAQIAFAQQKKYLVRRQHHTLKVYKAPKHSLSIAQQIVTLGLYHAHQNYGYKHRSLLFFDKLPEVVQQHYISLPWTMRTITDTWFIVTPSVVTVQLPDSYYLSKQLLYAMIKRWLNERKLSILEFFKIYMLKEPYNASNVV